MNPLTWAVAQSATLLARAGVIDEVRGRRIADIAWPQFAIGVARMSQRTADFVMVGIAIGPAAIAGLGFAFAYWSIARSVGFSLTHGGMTFMAQRFGAGDPEGLDLAFKQTLWLELALAACFTALFVGAAGELIALFGAAPEALAHGTIYLQVVAIGLVFGVMNQLAASALISANDAWTPMHIRAGGAVLNILLNAALIFGFGLGVFGAALGTVIATAAVWVVFAYGLVRGRLPGYGPLPIRISLTRPYFDRTLTAQIAEVGIPLIGHRVVSRLAQFPMLLIVAEFGTVIVAAYVASREVRSLANTPGWGFNAAGRSLAGQALGADDEEEAGRYGWDTLRFSVAVYAVVAVGMFIFAGPIASVFSDDPAAIAATVPFVAVMAVSLLGMGVEESAAGVLSGGGDTRWPLYARLIGLYVVMIPVASLGLVTPLGLVALYLAVTAETVVPAVITFWRFASGKWIAVSRRYRHTPSD